MPSTVPSPGWSRIESRKPGLDRVAAPLLVVEEGDLGFFECQEVALDCLGRTAQFAGQRSEVPATVPLLDQAEDAQDAAQSLNLPGSSIRFGTPLGHDRPSTRPALAERRSALALRSTRDDLSILATDKAPE